jgi:hypothetical protein
MRRDEDNRRQGDPRYWGEQRSRDEVLREQQNKIYRNQVRDRDRDYLGGRREEQNPRGDTARQGDTRSRRGGGSPYRYGEDDYSPRSRQDQGGGRQQGDRQEDRRIHHQDRDWERRKDEYGYGRHNYDVFGHEVARGGRDQERMTRGDRGDYESYRRYEQGNRNYDNDYTTGFAGRNYSDRPHYGEGTRYGDNDNINRSDSRSSGRGRPDQSGGSNQSRDRGESYGYYDRNSGGGDR